MSDPMTALAIFACSNDTHVRIFAPVMTELAQAYGMHSRILSLDHYLAQDAGVEAERQGLPWDHLACPTGLRGSYWEDSGWRRVVKRWAAARAFRKLAATQQPRVLVVGHDASVIEWPLVQIARESGMATVLVQDGVRMWSETRTTQPTTAKRLVWSLLNAIGCPTTPVGLSYGHGGCDRVAVHGDALRRALTAEGARPESIVVTGNPRLDSAARLSRAAAREELGLSQGHTVAVLATQPLAGQWVMSQEAEGALLESVLRQFAQLPPDMLLLVKLHPRESLDQYRERLRAWGLEGRLQLLREGDSLQIATASNVLISFHSTVLLEAIAVQCPVVVVDLIREVRNVFAEEGVGPVVTDVLQLPGAVMRALGGGPWERRAQALVLDQCFRVDGQSARRVADVIADAMRARGALSVPASSG